MIDEIYRLWLLLEESEAVEVPEEAEEVETETESYELPDDLDLDNPDDDLVPGCELYNSALRKGLYVYE